MREIKFRAWDKVNKKMIYSEADISYIDGDGIEGTAAKTVFIDIWGNVNIYHHSTGGTEEIEMLSEGSVGMEYLGLEDKNKKEIYEGDIVYAQHGESYMGAREYVKFIYVKDFIEDVYGLSQYEDLLLLGNIYENPELLERLDK
jgi:uncharacterized phage protein (TIGR01671 family)